MYAARCLTVLYIGVKDAPFRLGDGLSKFSGPSSLKCYLPSSTVYQEIFLHLDLMRQWGYFKGDWLNEPVCWRAPGLPMMNGQTQGLYAGVECFAGLCSVTLVQNMKKIHSPGLIDDQST